MKRHFQATKVRAAEAALLAPVAGKVRATLFINFTPAYELVNTICKDYDIPRPATANGGLRVTTEVVHLPGPPVPAITVTHAMAHLLTDPIFPPHGAEFCRRWLDLTERYCAKGQAILLEDELDERKVHCDHEERLRVASSGIRYRLRHKPGQDVELVMDDPPQRVRGALEDAGESYVCIGGREFDIARARYLYG